MATAPNPAASGAGEPDPSMDDILASIRRILDDDDKTTKPTEDGVLMLDRSMIVEEDDDAEAVYSEAIDDPGTQPEIATPPEMAHSVTDMLNEPLAPPGPTVSRDAPPPAADEPAPTLIAPATAAAAANSVGTLMRTLAAERSAAVSRGGVTIEDLVREEVRPVLKSWLDTHLPPLVERLVRAEIERVVGRNAG